MRRAALSFAATVAACSGGGAPPGTVTPRDGAQVSEAEFASLRWLEGRWSSGRSSNRQFERYDFVSDTLIRIRTYPNASFRGPVDSSFVVLRDDRVFAVWRSAEWVATELTPVSVSFMPLEGAPNAFSWHRTGDGRREVRSTWQDAEGRTQRRVLRLRRVP